MQVRWVSWFCRFLTREFRWRRISWSQFAMAGHQTNVKQLQSFLGLPTCIGDSFAIFHVSRNHFRIWRKDVPWSWICPTEMAFESCAPLVCPFSTIPILNCLGFGNRCVDFAVNWSLARHLIRVCLRSYIPVGFTPVSWLQPKLITMSMTRSFLRLSALLTIGATICSVLPSWFKFIRTTQSCVFPGASRSLSPLTSLVCFLQPVPILSLHTVVGVEYSCGCA